MITVAGFNTAIDRFIQIDALTPGEVHRVRDERIYPGGKGVHVAQTIASLGERVRLVGPVDDAYQAFIARQMSARGVLFRGVEIESELRHCLALQETGGSITEVLGQGPQLTQLEQDDLLREFGRSAQKSDLVILSGSLPRGFAENLYAGLVEYVRDLGKHCLVDASGEVLRQAVNAKPYLVKPNRDEISELVGHPVINIEAAHMAVTALRERGIAMPVVTLGELGAIAADDTGVWHAQLASARLRNAVGSGDCFLAGMAVAIKRELPLEQALRLAVACGVANAESEETGFAERSKVDALVADVVVRRL
ncbi:1-phosphofructokinase family hexose kinase [Dyella nitratireducens]|uniref:Phosphofructokinase n=1 Tax=Dyella nitratireducens TaxID=1849580 RepID=A0ABQ1FKY0_9GAMM|nr:1-phosphofructokinase family hexose kinase [Dyella nitratireducens]GGA19228.1 tagatose-6-phosphate kinase [Dyella nitratireducens]GLQ44543.1 tagatose-6-phosphate kinase [Dyella nitratireducens]